MDLCGGRLFPGQLRFQHVDGFLWAGVPTSARRPGTASAYGGVQSQIKPSLLQKVT